MAERQLYFKGMLENGQTRYGRKGWLLPEGRKYGAWMPKVDNIVMCVRGYHVCTLDQLPLWIGPAIYVVEVRGRSIEEKKKSVWSEARLIRRIRGWDMESMVTWAKRCAEHVPSSTYAATYATYTAAYAATYAATYATHANAKATSAAAKATSAAATAAAAYATSTSTYAAIYAASATHTAYAAYGAADTAADTAHAAECAWQVDLLRAMLKL